MNHMFDKELVSRIYFKKILKTSKFKRTTQFLKPALHQRRYMDGR